MHSENDGQPAVRNSKEINKKLFYKLYVARN